MSERPGQAGAGRATSDRGGAPLVLYRCPTPTNVLCPCGAVARRLDGLGLKYRVERVPYRRTPRPEIEELTHQRRVPVLIDGDEVIHDSRRILQYLDWAYEKPKKAGKSKRADKAGKSKRLRNGEKTGSEESEPSRARRPRTRKQKKKPAA
ncbi:MAG TPA: glutathione S-transferase N-terminal domain-containing protein [Acidimicrobiia bacterium]|jgi:glutathione S-transferase|nr:glutathione S-transferase N-terminal domain-containing protein [Acidimicrobiia bacterium]